ncbi:Uncharacterised protein [Vibrio cholerae]|uniref:Uncharacterized protein n=1 Tax=Vibrio cholerae TaxID=666 RepID=A0A655PMT2_VIBCL|nr:Uncharacterised protein [Vibrio cholerae]
MVLLTHSPKRAGIGCAYRFAFIQNGGATVNERRIHNIGVTDYPAHIRSCPKHPVLRHVVDNLH